VKATSKKRGRKSGEDSTLEGCNRPQMQQQEKDERRGRRMGREIKYLIFYQNI